jgi:hypothetical protein
VLPDGTSDLRGELPASGSLYLADQSDGWVVTTGAGDTERDVPATDALGWAQWFDDVDAGQVRVTHADPLALRAATLATPLLWVLALWWLIRHRRQLGTGAPGSATDEAAAQALEDLEVVA